MTIRRFLILAPVLITSILLASYFWVPSYEEQTRGNPHRLEQFITATIGDASLLNPVIYTDSTSGDIVDMVFQGLIGYDENLEYRGRVAHSWRIYEHAYFYINAKKPTLRWGTVDGSTLAEKLRAEFKRDPTRWQYVISVDLLPPEEKTETVALEQGDETHEVTFKIKAPERIRITLNQVEQLLFDRLSDLLGPDYFTDFDAAAHVSAAAGIPKKQINETAAQLLPATVHNPVIEFYLRSGVLFHDGHEVTAEDVAFTYRAIMNPKNISPRLPDFEPVQSIRVLDPLTLRVVYKRLYSPALLTWAMEILPAHLLDDTALRAEAKASGKDPDKFTMRDSKYIRNPIGCGPFIFKEWKSDRYIRLVRFDNYWEGPPNYKEYVLRIIPDPLTQEMEFYAGTIDSYGVQPHQVARLSQDDRFQSFSATAFGYTYIGYNMRRVPFDDQRVRRALGMAIDTQKIIDYVLYGQGEQMTGPFPKQTDYYDKSIAPLPYDPEGAKALLAEAGWLPGPDGYLQKDGRRMAFTLITNNGNPLRKAVLAIAQDAWKKIGIQVKTDLLEWSVFIQKRVNQLDFDALVLGWTIPIEPDPFQVWHSSQTGKFQLNFVGFKNKHADDLILKIRREYNHAQQVAYCHQLHKIIAAAQPYTFLYVNRATALLDKRIVRKITLADGRTIYKAITPDKSGGYTFHFNQWIKLPHAQPELIQ